MRAGLRPPLENHPLEIKRVETSFRPFINSRNVREQDDNNALTSALPRRTGRKLGGHPLFANGFLMVPAAA
jgi:hypothetical protein